MSVTPIGDLPVSASAATRPAVATKPNPSPSTRQHPSNEASARRSPALSSTSVTRSATSVLAAPEVTPGSSEPARNGIRGPTQRRSEPTTGPETGVGGDASARGDRIDHRTHSGVFDRYGRQPERRSRKDPDCSGIELHHRRTSRRSKFSLCRRRRGRRQSRRPRQRSAPRRTRCPLADRGRGSRARQHPPVNAVALPRSSTRRRRHRRGKRRSQGSGVWATTTSTLSHRSCPSTARSSSPTPETTALPAAGNGRPHTRTSSSCRYLFAATPLQPHIACCSTSLPPQDQPFCLERSWSSPTVLVMPRWSKSRPSTHSSTPVFIRFDACRSSRCSHPGSASCPPSCSAAPPNP